MRIRERALLLKKSLGSKPSYVVDHVDDLFERGLSLVHLLHYVVLLVELLENLFFELPRDRRVPIKERAFARELALTLAINARLFLFLQALLFVVLF